MIARWLFVLTLLLAGSAQADPIAIRAGTTLPTFGVDPAACFTETADWCIRYETGPADFCDTGPAQGFQPNPLWGYRWVLEWSCDGGVNWTPTSNAWIVTDVGETVGALDGVVGFWDYLLSSFHYGEDYRGKGP